MICWDQRLMSTFGTHFSCCYMDDLVWFRSYFPLPLIPALGHSLVFVFLLLRLRSKTDLLFVVIKMRKFKNGLKLSMHFLARLSRRLSGLMGEMYLRQGIRSVLY